jgi:O-antigen/teichoic acid export membrane protein
MPHFLSTEQVGLTRALVDAAILLATLAQLGTGASVMRFYPHFKDKSSKDHGFFFWTLVVPFFGIFIFSFLYIIFKAPISEYFQKNASLFVQYYYYVIPLAFFVLYLTIFEVNANVLMRITVPKFIREVGNKTILLVSYLLFAFNIISLDGLIISLSVNYALCTLLNIIYLFSLHRISIKPDFSFITKKLAKEYLFYTLFLVIAALGTAIMPFLNSFFLTGMMGLAFTGIWAIASNFVALIEMPYRSLGAITQPAISEAIKNSDFKEADRLCKQVSLHQLLLVGFIFILIWINIDTLFAIMPNGEQYVAGKWVVFILGISRLLSSALSIGGSIINYSKYYYFSLIFTIIMTVAAVLFNNYLIPIYGLEGAAFATLIPYIIYFILIYGFNYLKFRTLSLSGGQLKILLILAILLAANFLSMKYFSPLLSNLPLKPLIINIIDSAIRSILTVSVGVFLVIQWQISDSVNDLLCKTIGFLRKKSKKSRIKNKL